MSSCTALLEEIGTMRNMRLFIVILFGLLIQGCTGLQPAATVLATKPVESRAPEKPLPIVITRDIPYTTKQDLDVFTPTEAGPWPVIVILHGMTGNKHQYESAARAIAEGGAAVFNANWRSKPWEAGELALMEDSACAVRFARASAADYGGDANRIVLFGHSIAGWSGSVIAMAGDDFEKDCAVRGISASPDAFVGYGGAYDAGESNPDGGASYLREENPQLWKRIYPYELIGRNSTTRFHLVVGERDKQFISVAQRFHDALKEAGYEVSLTILAGANHEGGDEVALARLYQIILDAAHDLSEE